jgi:hypothetical protein
MAREGRTTCAVDGCSLPLSGANNLCDERRLPGGVVRVGNSTMVITTWVAQHEDEAGIILLNDSALGDLFGGRAGFEKRLRDQGFTGARLMCTPGELEAASGRQTERRAIWRGPWRTTYAWKRAMETKKRKTEEAASEQCK